MAGRGSWNSSHTLQTYARVHNEQGKKSGVEVAPLVLGSTGVVQNIFPRVFEPTDSGPLVLTTVAVDGNTYIASCDDDLIFFRINTAVSTVQRVVLPSAASCAGGFFVIKDDLGVAGTPNPHNPGVNYRIQVRDSTSTIDGESDYIIETQYQAVWLLSDGTNYNILEIL